MSIEDDLFIDLLSFMGFVVEIENKFVVCLPITNLEMSKNLILGNFYNEILLYLLS